MIILSIESSCDETAAAIVESQGSDFKLLSNVVSSQEEIHAQTGGIVPEVAARLHVQNMLPIVELALKKAKTKMSQIDVIAVCSGPGLISSLMVGVETAKSLAFVYDKPVVRVNHVEGHIYSVLNQISNIKYQKLKQKSKTQSKNKKIQYPAVGLIVSGGHTQIIYIEKPMKYKLIGQTRDDAAGEAFDKVAKIMGLGYPGGPAISKKGESGKDKDERKISLPRPMIDSKDFDMSFSGLKTAVLYAYRDMSRGLDQEKLESLKSALAYEFQEAVVDLLTAKTVRAVEKYQPKSVILGGGVSANKRLKAVLQKELKKSFPKIDFLYPELAMSGDNAAMIGFAAIEHVKQKDFVDPFELRADPNWDLV